MPTSVGGRSVRALVEEFEARGIETIESTSFVDGRSAFLADASIAAVLIDWTSENASAETLRQGAALLDAIRARNADVPVILLADRPAANTLDVDLMTKADEYVFMLEDTVAFIAARVMAAIQRYTAHLLPPFTRAMIDYLDVAEYSWAAPGHQGGVAFNRSPAGRILFDLFGENLFRTDSGVERASLGSLLGHSGAIGASEAYAARVFGAHRSVRC